MQFVNHAKKRFRKIKKEPKNAKIVKIMRIKTNLFLKLKMFIWL